MKLRQDFVLRALEPHANVSELCREYGISRKTGYKWLERFKQRGVIGLEDLSRRPNRSPLRASGDAVLEILRLRGEHPRWGPRKLAVVAARVLGEDATPSVRTIARILERAGEVRRGRGATQGERPTDAPSTDLSECNERWTVDFKGWWRAGDGSRCEPLTVRDAVSRFVLCARLVEDTRAETIKGLFEGLFDEWGLPRAIQVDNGSPFACTRARAGLTTLSAWWVSLGIELIRGRPGHPQDNGAHERMHVDMRFDVEDLGAPTVAEQQAKLDQWRHEFNHVRPHEALDMQVPSAIYCRSPRRYMGPRPQRYPATLETRRVNPAGRVRYHGHILRIGAGLRGFDVGLQRTGDLAVRAYFYEIDLGEIQLTQRRK
ncbi:IS481 family transposase [Enhygromyxa salina]|uniref:IS481 family transposase n=1 Tax=Enhygromyxa salina TaxID=215803 RepID=UPI0023E4781C|nr:IS481 family transposase [Enhygromyxa salina]